MRLAESHGNLSQRGFNYVDVDHDIVAGPDILQREMVDCKPDDRLLPER